MNTKVILYTAGECSRNPGPGGYAAIVTFFNENGTILNEREIFGGEAETAKHQMDLMALIVGLKTLREAASVTVVCNSPYIVNNLVRTEKRKQHRELWAILDRLVAKHSLEFGMKFDPISQLYRRRCAQLATSQSTQFRDMRRVKSANKFQAV